MICRSPQLAKTPSSCTKQSDLRSSACFVPPCTMVVYFRVHQDYRETSATKLRVVAGISAGRGRRILDIGGIEYQ